MDKRYGRGRWRPLPRTAILQKDKWRCIDDGRRSKHNAATRMRERITCGRADFPLVVSRAFARILSSRRYQSQRAGGGVWKRRRMGHSTCDLEAAYRKVTTQQPQYTCVAVWDPDQRKVRYCDLYGHNFGLLSAVTNFNRFPELATAAARRLLWVVTEHYFDDNDIAEPEWADGSGMRALKRLCGDEFFGFAFDDDQDSPWGPVNEYLGVVSGLPEVDRGSMTVDVSEARRDKIKLLVDQSLSSTRLASGGASSIFGKARFMMSPCYGAVGKACLQPIKQRQGQPGRTDLDPYLRDSLEFVSFVCDRLPALTLPILPPAGDKVVVFTDAEGKKRRGDRIPSGHVGYVVYHPDHGVVHGHAPVPRALVELMDRLKKRDVYIGQFELCAAITPLRKPASGLVRRPVGRAVGRQFGRHRRPHQRLLRRSGLRPDREHVPLRYREAWLGVSMDRLRT